MALTGNSSAAAVGGFTSDIVVYVTGADAISAAGVVESLRWIPTDISQPAIWAPETPMPDTWVPVIKTTPAWVPISALD